MTTILLIYLLVFRFNVRMIYLRTLLRQYRDEILVYFDDCKRVRTRYKLYIIFCTVFVDVSVVIDLIGQSKKYGSDISYFIRKLIYE